MPTTAKGLRYPSGTDAPDIPTDLNNLASDIDALIGNTPLTTKGDLLTYSTAETRLAVSATDGHALIADSTQATGLRWGVPDLAGGWEYIGTVTTASSAATASFTGISGYQTLRVHMRYKTNQAANQQNVLIQANGITASTGTYNALRTVGTTSGSIAGTFATMGYVVSNQNNWGVAYVEFYAADQNVRPNNRTVYFSGNNGAGSSQELGTMVGCQAATGAITSLRFIPETSTFTDNTRITLYGIKAFGV
jgi:hypothetical protein